MSQDEMAHLRRKRPGLVLLLLGGLLLAACRSLTFPSPAAGPVAPTATPASATATLPPPSSATPVPPTATPSPPPPVAPTVTADLTPTGRAHPVRLEVPGRNGHPTLEDFWEGKAIFTVDVWDTGLPMGESDTIVRANGELWSYLHASTASAGVRDRFGAPVPFPGCTVIYRSYDGGRSFVHDDPPVCQFACAANPCTSEMDHIEQQQYPRIVYTGEGFLLVYEYLGRTRLRRSTDGLNWSAPEKIADTGIWKLWLRTCRPEERIGEHPFVPYDYECLAGAPPGIYVDGEWVYVFVGMGQNPGHMGCFVGDLAMPGERYQRCEHNPLFTGVDTYGPLELRGSEANPYFDFRTISSADVLKVGERVYMVYEGVRGPGPGDAGDTQFGLALARSLTPEVDGPWETYRGNPILVDLPGNVGLGHADLVVLDGQTFLYTSLDGKVRSRLALVWL